MKALGALVLFVSIAAACGPSSAGPIAVDTPIPLDSASMATTNPHVVESGTHIVGMDMKPGLYKGQAGTASCYWARLGDVSGSPDSILANQNSVGQYYLRVKDTDYAVETACPLELLPVMPMPLANMPTRIEAGMYLVGIDIQPGTYEVQAGSNFCYWARLREVDGDPYSIIANEHSNGQFYIQVSPNDLALDTSCTIARIGD